MSFQVFELFLLVKNKYFDFFYIFYEYFKP